MSLLFQGANELQAPSEGDTVGCRKVQPAYLLYTSFTSPVVIHEHRQLLSVADPASHFLVPFFIPRAESGVIWARKFQRGPTTDTSVPLTPNLQETKPGAQHRTAVNDESSG